MSDPTQKSAAPKPTVGRIVHVQFMAVDRSGDPGKLITLPAIVVRLNPDDPMVVDLQVFSWKDVYPKLNCRFSEKPQEDHWSWPKVEAAK